MTVDGKASAAAPKRGRPRSEKARHAILEAAAELLLSRGLGAVSMDAVAETAGVSKATIYRWWPSKEMLALDNADSKVSRFLRYFRQVAGWGTLDPALVTVV